MTPIEVLRSIGAPDFVNFRSIAWEYEMDVEEPYTLRIIWRDKRVVGEVVRSVPALWQQGEVRDHEVLW